MDCAGQYDAAVGTSICAYIRVTAKDLVPAARNVASNYGVEGSANPVLRYLSLLRINDHCGTAEEGPTLSFDGENNCGFYNWATPKGILRRTSAIYCFKNLKGTAQSKTRDEQSCTLSWAT